MWGVMASHWRGLRPRQAELWRDYLAPPGLQGLLDIKAAMRVLSLSHTCCFDQVSGVFCSGESDSSTRQLVYRQVGVVNCNCH